MLTSSLSLKVAPRGLNRVQPMMCGTCSNENAMKAAFIAYMVTSLFKILYKTH